jgi:hypothetical protein
MPQSLAMAWQLASGEKSGVPRREFSEGVLEGIPADARVPASDNPAIEAARQAILESIRQSCGAAFSEALGIQARHAAEFLAGKFCREGNIGAEYQRTMMV